VLMIEKMMKIELIIAVIITEIIENTILNKKHMKELVDFSKISPQYSGFNCFLHISSLKSLLLDIQIYLLL